MGARTPTKTERNEEVFKAYSEYEKTKATDPEKAANLLIDMIGKFRITDSRLKQLYERELKKRTDNVQV